MTSQLIMYTDWKHGEDSEDLRISLDIPLNTVNKNVLFKFVTKFLEKYELTYEESYTNTNGDDFVLTMDEFETMLNKAHDRYCLGENNGKYLYPVGVRQTLVWQQSWA